MSTERAGVGKIERLPWELREQVCRRLRDGETAATICAWLNTHPTAQAVLAEHFAGQPVNAQNLSAFRANGFAKWEARQRRLDRTKEWAVFSLDVAKASGGNLADGAAQVLSGSILELLEQLEDLKAVPDDETAEARQIRLGVIAESLDSLTMAVNRIRQGDHKSRQIGQKEKQLAHAEAELRIAQEKWEAKLAEIAAQKRAIEGAVNKARTGGLSKEALKQIEEAAALL